MKKHSPAFLLAVSITALLFACGGSDSPSSITSAANQNTSATSAQSPTGAPQAAANSAPTPTVATQDSENTAPDTRLDADTDIDNSDTIVVEGPTDPLQHWRYVNSGWVSPRPEEQVGPLEEELRGFVITSQEELDAFQTKAKIRVSRGTGSSLGRMDFPNSILLAAYLMWRPFQGDPLSVVGFAFEPGQDGAAATANIQLELDDSPQGRERPFLLAPMTMVALERSIFPDGEPIDFVFHLDGGLTATVSSTFGSLPD